MKLTYLLFETEDYVRQGNMFGSFLQDFPEEKQKIINKLNIPEKQKITISKLIDEKISTFGLKEEYNQVFAVLAGKKPMFFHSFYNGKPTLPSGKLGEAILNSLENFNLITYHKGEQFVMGTPESVKMIIPELERINGDYNKMDKQFHYKMGIALGYPEKDVLDFIKYI